VHGENLLVDDSGNRQAVEAIRKGLPQLDVVPSLALVVEAIDAIDRRALMIATQDEEVLGVLDLVREKQTDGFQRLFASIDVISEEEIVCFWWKAAVLEQAEEIVVLAVYVTADLETTLTTRGTV
jgi:hypothetical protein